MKKVLIGGGAALLVVAVRYAIFVVSTKLYVNGSK